MTRILVTGGAGFIGSHLVSALFSRGDQVTVLDSLSPQVHGADPEKSPLYRAILGKARFLRGSICDPDALAQALAGQQAVVHLAAETGTGQSMYQVGHYAQVNVSGTALLLDFLAQTGTVRRLVLASSRAIYGEGSYRRPDGSLTHPPPRTAADMQAGVWEVRGPQGEALTPVATAETARVNPSSVYGITKAAQEQLVMVAAPLTGVEPVALRLQNVFGPGQSLGNPYTGVLSIFANLILQGREIPIFEDGHESRDFVYVSDAVAAVLLGLDHPAAAGGVFNVGSGAATSILTLAQTLCHAFGREVPLKVTGNFRLGDIRHNLADLRQVATLGYAPKIGLAEGIARFAAWASAQGPVENGFAASLDESRRRGVMK